MEQFENLCEVQTDKASVTITSRYDEKILKLHHDVDKIALVGKSLLEFDLSDDGAAASQNKVNLTEVKASGPNGRILKSDVLEHLNIIPPTSDSNRSKLICCVVIDGVTMPNQERTCI